METASSSLVGDALSDEEGEDGDGESSSNEGSLRQFRNQWQQELQTSMAISSASINNENFQANDGYRITKELQSLQESLFNDGKKSNQGEDLKKNELKSSAMNLKLLRRNEGERNGGCKHNLLKRFQKLININEVICQAEHEQKMTHISILPLEVLLYVFKWVISSELDMQSLDQLSMVCRGFYVCARDSELWKLACYRVWGEYTGNPAKFGSWRNMYLQRTRLRYNGVYISKTTYVRHGECSYQDQFYRPWHMVEYFRYLRFFADGIILMLTTPDDPHSSIGKLNQRFPKTSAVLVGHYRLHESSVVAVLRRALTPESINVYQQFNRCRCHHTNNNDGEQTFHIALEIKNHKQKANYKLVWTQYAIHTFYKNGKETTSAFDLVQNKFPPFWFSCVKSYTAESQNPLQRIY